jgi:hypothetical protein
MAAPLLCLVTLHGIGFEQAPENGAQGYADPLHLALGDAIDTALGAGTFGDDPNRLQQGERGAIYVQSYWPPQSYASEPGLDRLGKWQDRSSRTIDTQDAPLTPDGARIAHVALVYSHLEEQDSHPGAGAVAGAMAAASAGHYVSVLSLARMAFLDAWALLEHHAAAPSDEPVSLQPRIRANAAAKTHWWDELLHRHHEQAAPEQPTGLLAVVRQLEDDVATYVCRNEVRERVRAFVREALLRLASRDDVDRIVINAHSNGSVVAFDVLSQFPPFLLDKFRWYVTAGSPLRKYAMLFDWGTQVGRVEAVGRWTNFWDERDPVADPLAPPQFWHAGDAIPPAGEQPGYFLIDGEQQPGLFQTVDPRSGEPNPLPFLEDRLVDNLAHSRGGGLQAHDYWDNVEQFVKPLAQILGEVLAAP